jgi:hypothetical protein
MKDWILFLDVGAGRFKIAVTLSGSMLIPKFETI